MDRFQVDILTNRMNDRILYSCVLASLLVHMVTIPAASLMIRAMPAAPVHVPIELVNVPRVEEVKTPEASPPPPEPKAAKITAPKLLSKPEIIRNTRPSHQRVTPKKKSKSRKSSSNPCLGLLPFRLNRVPSKVAGTWASAPAKRKAVRREPAIFSARAMWVSSMGAGFQVVAAETGTAGLGRGAKGDGTGVVA